MWYVSANRDDAVFERPNEFLIDRKNARQHLSFGIGVHFCMGSRLAEMQLRVLWEETLGRFREVEVVGKPVRVRSNFVKGYTHFPSGPPLVTSPGGIRTRTRRPGARPRRRRGRTHTSARAWARARRPRIGPRLFARDPLVRSGRVSPSPSSRAVASGR